MARLLTLAHISDVHLGPLPAFGPRHWNLKRTLGYFNWQRKRRHVHRPETLARLVGDLLAQRPDHIAVTGDLVNIALPGEYEAARLWLESLGDRQRVSAIPGNHDIYTALGGDPGVTRWNAFMASDAAGVALGGASAPGRFPYVRLPAEGVAIVGVNSAVPTRPFVASGEVGARQIEDLARILELAGRAGLLRIVLIHHPPLPGQAEPIRGLRDAAAMADVLARHGAELVLHGHNHTDSLHWHDGPLGRIPVVGIASGSASRPHRFEGRARYNLIEIDADPMPPGGGPCRASIRVSGRCLAPDGHGVEDAAGGPVGLHVAYRRGSLASAAGLG